MAELGIDAKEGKVFFGQLLGMCDAVTYALGNHFIIQELLSGEIAHTKKEAALVL